MSLFLGPIHKILFGKIKFQEDLYNFLIARAMDQNPDSQLDEYIFENCQHLPAGELEDVVDTTNIHGSLQSMIVIVEKKLAFTVNEIVKHRLLPWADIVRLSGRYGELNAFRRILLWKKLIRLSQVKFSTVCLATEWKKS